MQFAEEGTKALAAFTEQKGKSIGLIVDDELLLVATIQGTITTGQIEIGSLTSEEIANTINSINHSKKK
ncbi:MAG: hypothetical protein JNL72_12690 [Flavipsychrobacter sp.]|nr:hypothetical protein [Flavipsychrobacter sp.]